ncbi:MAG: hypothetical protein Q6365_001320 [Candidatus Sigynarchaeota archaeon]
MAVQQIYRDLLDIAGAASLAATGTKKLRYAGTGMIRTLLLLSPLFFWISALARA